MLISLQLKLQRRVCFLIGDSAHKRPLMFLESNEVKVAYLHLIQNHLPYLFTMCFFEVLDYSLFLNTFSMSTETIDTID